MGKNLEMKKQWIVKGIACIIVSLFIVQCSNDSTKTHYIYIPGSEWSSTVINKILIAKQEFDITQGQSSGCNDVTPTTPPPESYELFFTDTSGTVLKQLSTTLQLSSQAIFRWSPAGNKIMILDNTKVPIRIIDTNGAVQRFDSLTSVTSAAWSPDGSSVICSGAKSNGAYSLFEITPGNTTISLIYSQKETGPVAWSKLNELAFVTVDSISAKLWLLTNATGPGILKLIDSASGFYTPSFSPDGNTLIYSRNTQTSDDIVTVNTTTLQQQLFLQFSDGTQVTSLRYSPDGTLISYYSYASSSQINLYVVGTDGSNPTSVASLSTDGSWSPDSRHVAYVLNNKLYTKWVN